MLTIVRAPVASDLNLPNVISNVYPDTGLLSMGYTYQGSYLPSSNRLSPIPLARFAGIGFSIGSKGYVGLGFDILGNRVKDFWEYDTATGVWTQKADFGGTARVRASAFVVGGKGYVCCGEDPARQKDLWEYDPSTDIWTNLTDFPGTARDSAVGFAIGSKGYVGMGSDGGMQNDFYDYTPSTDTWTAKAVYGGGLRAGAKGVSFGSKGYVSCGVDGASATQKDLWEYDPVGDAWTQLADLPGVERRSHFALASTTKIVVGTGEALADIYEYNPLTNIWVRLSNLEYSWGASDTFFFSIGDDLYIGGGTDGNATFDNFVKYVPTQELHIYRK